MRHTTRCCRRQLAPRCGTLGNNDIAIEMQNTAQLTIFRHTQENCRTWLPFDFATKKRRCRRGQALFAMPVIDDNCRIGSKNAEFLDGNGNRPGRAGVERNFVDARAGPRWQRQQLLRQLRTVHGRIQIGRRGRHPHRHCRKKQQPAGEQ